MENNEFDKTNYGAEGEINEAPIISQQPVENTPVRTPEKPARQVSESETGGKSIGAVVGSIIIIVIIIIGGLYFWGKQIVKKDNLLNTTAEDIQKQPDEVLDSLKTLNNSDEISDIEADLNATDLKDLEKELENIDLELGL